MAVGLVDWKVELMEGYLGVGSAAQSVYESVGYLVFVLVEGKGPLGAAKSAVCSAARSAEVSEW